MPIVSRRGYCQLFATFSWGGQCLYDVVAFNGNYYNSVLVYKKRDIAYMLTNVLFEYLINFI